MVYVSEPAVQFLHRHRRDFVRKFAESICNGIHGEEVGSVPAVNQFFSSSTVGASVEMIAFAMRATMLLSALFSSVGL